MNANILVGHGTRELKASQPVHDYAQALSKMIQEPVHPALREFIEPSLANVVRRCYQDGARKFFIIPFFLFRSAHATSDIENDLTALRSEMSDIQWVIGEPLGFEPAIVNVLHDRFVQLRKTI